jgi:hypothetical protein
MLVTLPVPVVAPRRPAWKRRFAAIDTLAQVLSTHAAYADTGNAVPVARSSIEIKGLGNVTTTMTEAHLHGADVLVVAVLVALTFRRFTASH